MVHPWMPFALAAIVAAPALVPSGGAAPSSHSGATSGPQDPEAATEAPAVPVLLGSWRLRHRDPVTFLVFARDGESVALLSGGMEGDVHRWDPSDGTLLGSAPRDASAVDGAAIADGALLFVRGDGTLSRWRAGAAEDGAGVPAEVAREVGTLLSASPDGARACLGGRDGVVRIVDVAAGAVAHAVALGDLVAGPSAFVPGGDRVVALGVNRNKLLRRGGTEGQASSVLAVLDAETGEVVRRIESPNRALRDLAVRAGAEGPEVVAVDAEGGVRTWRLADGTLRGAWDPEPAEPATCLAVTPDGAAVAVGRADGQVVVLGLADGEERGRVRAGARPISALAIAPDGATLAAAIGTEIFLFDLPDLTPRAPLFRHAGPVSALAWSADGARIATGSLDRTARVWSAADGAGEVAIEASPGFVYGVALGDGGIAAGGQDGHVRLFEPDGRLRVDVAAHTAACTAVALSPDGMTLATAGADGVVQLLDPQTGEQRAAVTGIPGLELQLAWSADGARVAVGAADVRVIDVASAQVVRTLQRPRAPITALAMSRDGGTIAAGLADKTIALYVLDGEVRFLHGHAGRVKAVAFAPLGTGGGAPRLASAAANETGVRLWDVAERKQLETLEGFQREVLALAFSPTGDRLAAGSMDGTARIWTLSE